MTNINKTRFMKMNDSATQYSKDVAKEDINQNLNKDFDSDNYKSETAGLEFKVYPIHFFPEDLEKMKNMDLNDKVEYMAYLKGAGRFVVEDEPVKAKNELN